MADFFISYTSVDERWAEWIGSVLEANHHLIILQKWDFVAGSNFVLEMHKAATISHRTIAVLSPDYLKSNFGAAEWAAAFAEDPGGLSRTLVPIRVVECAVEGLIKSIVYIDLVGLAEEASS